MQPKNLNDVFESPDLSIIEIRKEIGIIGIRAILVLFIDDVINFFNVGKTMDENQVAITCDLVIEAFPYLKLEDLKLCFKNAMLLKYGKLYDRIDGAIIIGWLKEYSKERDDFAMMVSDNAIMAIESELNNGVYYHDYLKNLKNRADSGDDEARNILNNHMSLKDILKSFKSDKYFRDRERQRLYGRGEEYETKYNKNLTKKNYRR